MKQHIRVAISLVVSLTIGGCGKNTSSHSSKVDRHDPMAATATERKPCDYVKRADAEKAVGMALPGTVEDVLLHECSYNTPDLETPALTHGASVTNSQWDQCKTVFENSHWTKIANLGDEAYFVREHLIIRKGERCLSVEIEGPLPDTEKDDGLARVTALAVTILPTF
ncbi:MAG: hypothetical protein ABI678_20600 [Kofleriaceae bacterium]